MMQYLMWRVMAGLNHKIEISFMMVGHTKFAPDWAFGLLKQKFRRSDVGCIHDLAKVVRDSATVNNAQVVGSEDGTVFVHQYNWASFFEGVFKRQAFDGIKSLHHLVFAATNPGKVVVRKRVDGVEKTIHVLSKAHVNWQPSPHNMPVELEPPGLSRERRTYLYEKIREFCPEETRDIACPHPDMLNSPSTDQESAAPLPPPLQPSPVNLPPISPPGLPPQLSPACLPHPLLPACLPPPLSPPLAKKKRKGQ
jgi:hypothetical protein